MAALVLAGRRVGSFGCGFMAIADVVRHAGHVHDGGRFPAKAREFAAEQGHGRERLHRQDQHHEKQQVAFEAIVHARSVAKSRNVSY